MTSTPFGSRTAALALILLAVAVLDARVPAAAAESSRPPNVVLIIADDLGYGDVGCYGQKKIKTPNIDRLAAEGMRFTQHYSGSPVCAPSRCVLMTGLHSGHSQVRNNVAMPTEGQFPLRQNTATLARLFKQAGYATGAFGKWGLGGPGTSGEPLQQGIDRFYGYNCQAKAHNFYPTHLWDNDQEVRILNREFSAHDKFQPGEDPADPKSYARFEGKQYSPDLIAEAARQFARQCGSKPFFLFWPTTVPHLALQVPDDSLQQYVGLWDDPPYTGGRGYLPHYRPRAAYAAMITRMDREIGRLMAQIEAVGLDRDTVFIFTSDNGPLYDKLGGTDCEFFNSNAGLRGRKGSVYEGGMRVPCIVRWKGHIAAGKVSNRITAFEDWLPTLLELTGHANCIPTGLDGISFVPTLLGQSQPERPFLYREFPAYGGQQCVRIGQWKAVRQNLMPGPRAKRAANAPAKPVIKTELYDLAADPTESRDVAAEHPDIVARLERVMRDQHVPSKDFPFPAID